MNMIGPLQGIPMRESILCTVKQPRRTHRKKPWMSKAYHERIQKKWNKRYGYWEVPTAYMKAGTIIAHPEIVRQLKEITDKQLNDTLGVPLHLMGGGTFNAY